MTQAAGTDEPALSLAADFPAAGDAQWTALIDKVLAGASFDKTLVARTYDGLAIRPLYTRADRPGETDPSGLPGGAPFVRGGRVLGTARDGWDVRQAHAHPDPATANAQILEDLWNGVTSILLKLDTTGEEGVAVRSLADLERTLEGVHLDLAPVVLEGYPSLVFAAILMALLEKKGLAGVFAGNFGLDLIAAFAAQGRVTTTLDIALARAADMAARTARTYPKARAFNVASHVYHSAGASEGQELGALLAAATAYLRAMAQDGMGIDAAAGQIAFTVTADADLFLTVAKIRALRRTWARVAEASGAAPGARSAPVAALSAPRMMTRRDPWVNILRTTVACFGAGVAGAEAVTVLPFDSALGLPGDLARRIARNTQTVLREESGLARVIDPAGGAWMFEALTDGLADTAWTFFQAIEREGGMAAALTGGFVGAALAATQAERAQNIARRTDAITGVSAFPDVHEAPVSASRPAPRTPNAAPQTPSDAAITLPAAGGGALADALVKAAAHADAAALVAALKASAGPVAGVSIAPLPRLRLAQDFERLRDTADAFKARHGHRPKVFLATLGSVAAFTARATFAKNFYEAGGFETVTGAGGADIAAVARDFTESGAPFAVLCAPDALYGEHAAGLAKALKAAGAAAVHLAGQGGALAAPLKTAGVDDFIFAGCDALAVLTALHARAEGAAS